MPTWLSDPTDAFYVVLFVMALVAVALWVRSRDRKSRFGAIAAVVVFALFVLCDRLFESPREESVRRVNAMVEAANARNPDAFAEHLADTVEYRGEGQAKPITAVELKKSGVWEVLKRENVRIAAWGFDRSDAKEIDADTVEVGFLAKGVAHGKEMPLYFRATFRREPGGAMKLRSFSSFDPMKGTNAPMNIPHFP